MFQVHLGLCSLFQTKIPEVEEETSGMDAVFVVVVVRSSPSIMIFVFFNQPGPVLESVHLIHATKMLCYLKLKCVEP